MESPVDRLATQLAVPIAYLLGSNKSNGTGDDPGIFIDTFCRPDLSPEDFQNQLGAFTPCFIDIALLTPAYAAAVILLAFRLYYLLKDPATKYQMIGTARVFKICAIVASFSCLAVPIMTLNGRLANSMLPLGGDTPSGIAPYEWIEYITAILAWLLFSIIQVREVQFYLKSGTWFSRFPQVLVLAANLAKLSFVVRLESVDGFSYFGILFIVFCCLQGYLGLVALFFFPSKTQLVANDDGLERSGYEQLPSAPPGPEQATPQQQEDEDEGYVCPEYKANWVSRLTYLWLAPLLKMGYEAPLQDADIWKVPPGDRVGNISPKFRGHWEDELKDRRGPSLFRALRATFGVFFKIALPIQMFNDVMQFGGPFFLNKLLKGIDNGVPSPVCYSYAFMMLVTMTMGTLADNQQFQLVMRAGFRLRAVLVGEVYRKALYLSPTSRGSVSSGKIINLMTTDVEQLKMVCQSLLGLVSAPLRIIICMVMLYQQLGVASLAGLAVLLMSTPANSVLMRKSQKIFRSSLVNTDERTKLINDLVESIDVVKCMAWEPMLLKRISDVRKTELSTLWSAFKLQIWINVLLTSIPTVVSVVAFSVYVFLGNELTAATAFTSLTLFNQLRFPLFNLPRTITLVTLAQVGLARLQEFLLLGETSPSESTEAAPQGQTGIRVKGDFTWDADADRPSLEAVDLDIPSGSLVAVVGGTGSGKSSLLQAMMGLMDQRKGPEPTINGTLAYVPQAAFIYGGTVRDNILFGNEFDQTRYNEAVDAACLLTDLELLPGGDRTELGEKGINVSGGQKQRISIARAVYSRHHVVLLDDPLSALDAKVGRRVFNRCIQGYLKDRTRVLVTNQLQFVEDADIILYMKDGRVAEKGSYQELMAVPDGMFAALMSEAAVEEDDDDPETPVVEQVLEAPMVPEKVPEKGRSNGLTLVAAEGRAKGALSMDTVKGYANALGGRTVVVVLAVCFLGQELARVAASLWLTFWTSSMGTGRPVGGAAFYLGIYSGLSLLQVVLAALLTAFFKRSTLSASGSLHDTMLTKLMRSPMSFFHTNPLGRIINRCTKDVSSMDKDVADNINMFARSFLTLISTVALMGSVSPILLPFIVVVMVLFYFIYLYFQASVRECKRLESVSYSPLYTSLTDAITGLSTIRAYGQQSRLITSNRTLIDGTSRFALAQQSFNRWLSVRQESLGAFMAFLAAVISIEERGSGTSAIMGLIVSYALTISSSVAATVRLISMAEVSFNSVDRVLEYCDLEEEAATTIEGSVPDEWPTAGAVLYSGVKMRYRDGLPLVLQGLDINFSPGTKCGVVGRTGAGKSSLINTMFRLMELDSGVVQIDGVDISKIGLYQLRGALSIIPQVPALFTGSLRFNLDPFDQYTDEEVWQAVKRANLHSAVRRNSAGLQMQLREGGAPFSAGQKQLVALARALLKSSKVLVLDEATANVDVETDALIQKTIREEFNDCTLIAIAHRLHTIIESDMIVVMDAGFAVECGKPAELLSNPEGVFTSMVAETGEATERFLRAVAFGETDIMMKELEEKANMAKAGLENISDISDPEETVKELAKMSHCATFKIKRLLDSMQEAQESASVMQTRLGDEQRVPGAFAAVMSQGPQLQEASEALRRILGAVSELEAQLVSLRGAGELPGAASRAQGRVVGSEEAPGLDPVASDDAGMASALPVSTRMLSRSSTMSAPITRRSAFQDADATSQL